MAAAGGGACGVAVSAAAAAAAASPTAIITTGHRGVGVLRRRSGARWYGSCTTTFTDQSTGKNGLVGRSRIAIGIRSCSRSRSRSWRGSEAAAAIGTNTNTNTNTSINPLWTRQQRCYYRYASSVAVSSGEHTADALGNNNNNNNNNSNSNDPNANPPPPPPPWKVAIVGSGPSGCYTAKYLLQGLAKLKLRAAAATTNNNNNNNNNNNDDDDESTDIPTNIPASLCDMNTNIKIDVLERLPTPYGLVRNGVAPDHPEVKNVQNDFDALFEEESGSSSSLAAAAAAAAQTTGKVRLFANVTVGGKTGTESELESKSEYQSDVTLEELRGLYDAVVLAYGCESDRELNLPVELPGGRQQQTLSSTNGDDGNHRHRLGGVLSARQFVNWYNGHPDFEWVTGAVRSALWKEEDGSSSGGGNNNNRPKPDQSIVVIGHGNVALDCARILAKNRDELDPTDLATRALDVLRPHNSNNNNDSDGDAETIRRSVTVVGRRGHVQAPFTIKEVRELTKLGNAELRIRTDELAAGLGHDVDGLSPSPSLSRPKSRIHKLLTAHAEQHQHQHKEEEAVKDVVRLRFLCNPVAYIARPGPEPLNNNDDGGGGGDGGCVLDAVKCERTVLDDPGSQTAAIAVGTGEFEEIRADLCLVSIGYKGLPIDDCTNDRYYDSKRGILSNDHGRVVAIAAEGDDDSDDNSNNESSLAPLYVSGWLKRGPSGIIGTNIGDAKDTVASILQDIVSGKIVPKGTSSSNDDDGDDDDDATGNATANEYATLEDLLDYRGVAYVDWNSYRRIEACEAGADHKRHPDQPREKLVDRGDLLEAASAASSGKQ